MRTWCPRHFDPVFAVFGNSRGLGYAAAVLVDSIRADPKVQADLKLLATEGPIPATDAYRVLSRYAPFCCYIGDAAMADVVEQAKVHAASEAN